jgi:putative sigma-54 modulation protein
LKIEVQSRNVEVSEELREAIDSRFKRVGKQVGAQATLQVHLLEERNPRIADRMVAEAILNVKGTKIRSRKSCPEMLHSIHEVAEDIRRQVKRYKEKRRGQDARSRRILARMRRRGAAPPAMHPES